MSAISTILARLRSAIWAIDVRDDIADAIEQCYSDVSNPTLQTDALEAAIQEKIDEGEMAALTIGDGTITAAKLAANAVTTPKIADGSITQAKLDPNIDFVQVDDTLSQTGEAADAAAVGAAIDELNGSLGNLYETGADVTATVVLNYALKSDGTYKSDANSELDKYPVTAGDILYLSLSADNAGVYQWQNSTSVPSSLPSSVIIGDPVTKAVDAFVKVPEGATYLIVSKLKANNTNVVKYASYEFLNTQDGTALRPEGIMAGYVTAASTTVEKATVADCRIVYYKATAGKYTVRKTQQTSAFSVSASREIPVHGTSVYNVVASVSATEIAITVDEDGYILVYCYNNDNSLDFGTIVNSITVTPELIMTELTNKMDFFTRSQNMLKEFTGEFVDEIRATDGEIVGRIIADSGANILSGLSTCVPIASWKKIYFEAQADHATYYAFLKKTLSDGSAIQYSSKVTGRKTVSKNSVAIIDVPDDAVYLYIQIFTGDRKTSLLPKSAYYYAKDDTQTEAAEHDALDGLSDAYNSMGFASDANGRDIPQTIGVLNAYKKAKQLNLLGWTALAAIPTNGSATGCAAGAHTGMLYSEALQFEKYVPYGCSIKSFMTAIHNPYSVMYTEDTKGTTARKKSAYGFNYLNTTLNGAFYGTVCSALVSWSLGMDWIAQSYDYDWLANDEEFIVVKDNSATGVRLMDVLWVPGHVQIVTDIYRDSRGNPTRIFITESAQDYVRTLERTPEFITNYLQSGRILRYRRLYENLEYEPSEFVAVEGETLETYTYNDDICTYLGDCVSIADWEDMFVNYTKGSYTSMELYKGNTLLQTITLPNEYNATHSIDVTSYLNGGGEYKARLTDGTNHSDYTYFEVVDTSVTASLASNGELTVNFASTQGEPVCIRIKEEWGHILSTYILSAQEKVAGTCKYNPEKLRVKQGRSTASSTQYVRVFFQGKYNQVMGDYVDSGLT